MSRMFAVPALHMIRFAGAAGVIWGVAYMINGITQVPGDIVVRVTYPPGSDDRLRLGGEGLPAGVRLNDGDLSLSVANSTVAEQVLSRADVLVGGLCMGAAALLLGGLLSSITRGRPFRRGNSARIAWLAVLMIVAGCGSVLPGIAQGIVIGRAGLTGTVLPSSGPSWVPIAGAVILLALALAFRQGAKSLRAAEVPGTPGVPGTPRAAGTGARGTPGVPEAAGTRAGDAGHPRG